MVAKDVCTYVPAKSTLVVDSPIKVVAGKASVIPDCTITAAVDLIIVVACIIIVRREDWDGSGLACIIIVRRGRKMVWRYIV